MALELDPRKTALVIIDLQLGIIARQTAPYDSATVVARAAALGRRFAEAGGTIALVKVAFINDDMPNQDVDEPMPMKPGNLPPQWTEFAPEIAALPAQITVAKRQWGAFYGTELDLQFRRRGITTLVLAGIATNFGVELTAREAWQHNYSVVIAEDACATHSDEMHRFAIEKILPRIARIRLTEAILSALPA